MSDAIRFDEATHRYYLGDREVPGVSLILKTMGKQGDYSFLDPFYALRGKYVHRACHLDMEGTLDDATLDPEIIPYISAWRKFRIMSHACMISMETICYNASHDYAGTHDFLGYLFHDSRLVLLDIKSGNPENWHRLQLAAYLLAVMGERWMECKAGNLYLQKTGIFRLAILDPLDLANSVAEWKVIVQDFQRREEMTI